MRDRIERFVVLPVSMGCAAQRSVEVGPAHSKKSKLGSNQPTAATRRLEESSFGLKVKNSWGLFSFSKPSISFGIHKLMMRNFKSFSQLFVYKETEEMEKETEMEMEIGFPTDVKHVGHIGWDRSTSTNPVKGWDNLKTLEILSFPSISLKQFELAMAAQVDHSPMDATSVANYT